MGVYLFCRPLLKLDRCTNLRGFRLLALFALWTLARIPFLFGTRFMVIAALRDLVFLPIDCG